MPDADPQPAERAPEPGRRAARDASGRVPSRRSTQGGVRRARVRKRHTIGKVLLAAAVVLGMLTGLGTVWLYRDLNGNLDVVDVTEQLTDRPEKPTRDLPREPINVLVMGSDTRDGEGNNLDGLTGTGERSDTTILFHLSANRKFAYGVSIPRDSLVTRPDCRDEKGRLIPGAENAMWNEAFQVGGPACTIQQFEQVTDVRIDHYVVVDFAGFQSMVDAIGGVPVCVPEEISDPKTNINIAAGTREIHGKEALDYVRVRGNIGDGSDIGRVKRQQAFIAAMANKVVSGGVLARPDRLVNFLQAATESLTVDPGLGNMVRLSRLGVGFQGIGLQNIRFITVPFEYDQREEYLGRVVWLPEAEQVWQKVIDDEPIGGKLDTGTINAADAPGAGGSGSGNGGKGGKPRSPEQQAALAAAGLCT